MISFSPHRRRVLGSFAIAGAWFFVAVSLLHLLGAVAVKVGDPGTTFKLYHAVVGDVSYDAVGLTYAGVFGLLLLLAQTFTVSGAAVASVLPQPRLRRWRRIGHGVLCGWAALWALNLSWLFTVDSGIDSFAQASLMWLLTGCTITRAALGWTPGRSMMTPDDSAGGEKVFGDAPPASFEPPADRTSDPGVRARVGRA